MLPDSRGAQNLIKRIIAWSAEAGVGDKIKIEYPTEQPTAATTAPQLPAR